MIELKNVYKNYGKKQALTDVTLQIGRGEIIGLFGANGAGKTTLMKCILNYLAYKGDITLDGEPITRKNIGKISFATCEHSFFPALTAIEHAEFYKAHFDNFRSKRFIGLMEFFGLPMKKPIRSLSTGQKNQFEVIMALCQGADFILMDEPFAGNDIFNREDFYKVLLGILEENETILLSTHLIEEVKSFVSRALLLDDGKLIGDVAMDELEDQGLTLTDYIKQARGYKADRVIQALSDLTEKED